ncbi:energy transducer TonB [Phocaeicola barnesiae]|uniref:energy transducer TonB n=1 Tax=Phocaeicola barnesiae TaxID=376804 RepID=UPI0025A43996|nr:energy transducer TonB [Phocaeicola barnesiae]MDM8308263.1 energy transducer TonB [Phocaeicola barnesiae]
MKTVRFYCFWVIGFLLVASCTRKPAQRETTASEQPSQEQIPDQSEGWKIIEALSKAYGDDPNSIGDFIGSPRCPDFLEGRYFDGNTLVLQVRGDTLRARKILEEVSGSKAFRIEMMTDSIFSEKQLKDLLDELNRRYNALPKGKLKANMMMWGSTLHFIEVTFIRNTPEARAEFRRLLMDSPAIRFSGPEEPIRNNVTGVSEAHGISLYPEYIVYADTASAASFILLNGSNEAITCGEHYFITYEGKDGQWYELPINTFANDIAYVLKPDSQHRFVARLYPAVNDNKPGRYRFFYEVSLESGENIRMMAEFRLTDDYEEARRAGKTPIPKTTGRNYVEVPQTDEQMVYQVVEEMPEFPGGMPALMEFIRKNLRHDKAETKVRVILQVVVDKEGNVTNPVVLRSVNSILDEEALRMVSLMPKWKPGGQAGKNRNVRFTFPVTFEPSGKGLQ